MKIIEHLKRKIELLTRCKRYASKLNRIDRLLTITERQWKDLSPDTKELIKRIDDILD